MSAAKDEKIDLIVNGESKCRLVYDDTDIYLTDQVKLFLKNLQDTYGIKIEGVAASKAQKDTDCEIVVGNIRPAALKVMEKLEDTNDFALCVGDGDWIICASNSRLYAYALAMAESRIAITYSGGNLTVESLNDYFFHNSDNKKDYLDYLRGIDDIDQSVLAKVFEERIYTDSDGTVLPYRLYVPFDYNPNKKYPVLLALHGAGERGNDNLANLKYILPQMFSVSDSPVRDSIIVVPQCPEGNQWVDWPWSHGSYNSEFIKISNELKTVMNIMKTVTGEFSTDSNRYYVVGMSMGGYGTWDLLVRYPKFFAAGVPICGGGDPGAATKIVDMPIWTFHGNADDIVPVSGTRNMVDALKKAGSTAIKYEEIDGGGHGVWGEIFTRKELADWLFSQSLSKR